MKVVFLDIDGVMNGVRHWPKDGGRQWIDPMTVARLNRITDATGAVIVISSTWRLVWDAAALLQAAGVTAAIVGVTPRLSGQPRGEEIAEWLWDRSVEQFVILDDDSDMGMLSSALIQTRWDTGLEDAHVKRAIARLSA